MATNPLSRKDKPPDTYRTAHRVRFFDAFDSRQPADQPVLTFCKENQHHDWCPSQATASRWLRDRVKTIRNGSPEVRKALYPGGRPRKDASLAIELWTTHPDRFHNRKSYKEFTQLAGCSYPTVRRRMKEQEAQNSRAGRQLTQVSSTNAQLGSGVRSGAVRTETFPRNSRARQLKPTPRMATASKVIIITGASRGLGLTIAHYLLSQPAKHRIVAVARSEKPLRELEKEYPGQVAVLAGDLADLSLGGKAVELAEDHWQRIDGVIVNHGVLAPVKRIANATAEEWRRLYDVNVFSAISLVQAALPALQDSKGSIIFVSSGAAVSAYPTWGAYGSSKAALNHLALTLAAEEESVTSLAIRPGIIDTEMQREIREEHNTVMNPEHVKKFQDLKSSGEITKPEMPGHVIAKLVLDPPKKLSGQFLEWKAEELKAYQQQ